MGRELSGVVERGGEKVRCDGLFCVLRELLAFHLTYFFLLAPLYSC